ncbi:PTS sugar transporter subunit IIA [Salibacterium halotolerans]|uniref:PTS system, nitrogen regulatory IIA component n=1 Tax=Salibacterium halotolerans TaxID=1884432 RepID=A0A1I5Y1X0_9BACI|nr:PTS sugar transporter subunit IIA [Salibacterium halotolerans]SFQ38178.1 PTS system, nitrogen regulatory IIA component [Salibacterium halotolerans]
MNADSLFHIYFNCDVETKEQTYAFLSEAGCPRAAAGQQKEIIQQLEEREKAGIPLIAEHVLLPHIESEHVEESSILLLSPAEPLRWGETAEDIRLVIAILLRKHEEEAVKQKIARFTRSLADDAFVDELVTTENEADFHQKIRTFQEEL